MHKTLVYRLLTLVVMIGLVVIVGQTAAPQAAAQDKVKLVVVGDGGANQIAWFWNQQEMQDEFGVTLEIIGFWGQYVLDKEFFNRAGWEVQNMLTVAYLVAESALRRTETRGVHCREDFPNTDPIWTRHQLLRRSEYQLVVE